MSHLNFAVDAGDRSQGYLIHKIIVAAQCLCYFKSITVLIITSNTHNRNTYCGVLLMDFEQHVDIITELEFSCHSIICSLQFLLTPVCRITQKAVLRNFPHYIKKPMATNDFTVKGIPFPEQCTHSSAVRQGFYPTGTGLVSLV